ncbi:uncharacterized protein [Spinacia oleracea]|uniref:Uncharacterized protein isoform X5 n=1 Tax=Spinacia oleracea TaxID=3562 RepID=A0ABM3QTL0_SPIOL|nr:uncharacterized protein LOC110785711 isoform X5 [Spinacia oleracea]
MPPIHPLSPQPQQVQFLELQFSANLRAPCFFTFPGSVRSDTKCNTPATLLPQFRQTHTRDTRKWKLGLIVVRVIQQLEAANLNSNFRLQVSQVYSIQFSMPSSLSSPYIYTQGIMTDKLRSFLEGRFQNSKTKEFVIGVADSKLGASISEGTKFSCRSNEFMLELLRGVRLHFEQFIKNLKVFLDLAEKDLRQIKALFLEVCILSYV